MDLRFLFVTGFLVGTVSAALGVGGGFLLVPILSICYGLPMYVLVAATIPYVIVLSAISLLTYAAIVPAVTGVLIPPEWAWGLLVAAGGVLGSWCAAKSQRYVPEHFPQAHAGRNHRIGRCALRCELLLSPPLPPLGQESTGAEMAKRLLPYLPFIVLAIAVVVAVLHVRAYW